MQSYFKQFDESMREAKHELINMLWIDVSNREIILS